MSAYRVTALYYRLRSENDDRYDDAAPLSGTVGPFTVNLTHETLEVVPSVEFRDRRAARDALEPRLRAWAEAAFLTDRAYRVHFDYERSLVEEVDPKPGIGNLYAEVHGRATVSAVLTGAPRQLEYPPIAEDYVSTETTARLAARLRRTRDGGDTWPTFAYFVLTQLEAEHGGNRQAAAALNISRAVLETVGRVSSKRDPDIGRKAGRNPEALTTAERAWLEAAVVRLVRRVGEHAAGGLLPPITMADFPAI